MLETLACESCLRNFCCRPLSPTQFGHTWATSGTLVAQLGPFWANSGQHRTESGKLLATIRPTSAEQLPGFSQTRTRWRDCQAFISLMSQLLSGGPSCGESSGEHFSVLFFTRPIARRRSICSARVEVEGGFCDLRRHNARDDLTPPWMPHSMPLSLPSRLRRSPLQSARGLRWHPYVRSHCSGEQTARAISF